MSERAGKSYRATFRRHMPAAWKGLFAIAGLALGVLVPASCRQDADGRSRPQAEKHIVVVAVGKDDPTWPVIEATAQWFESQRRFVTVEAVAPEKTSPVEQQQILEALATQRVDAVCVAPVDPRAIRQVIKDLVHRGKRVALIGRDVPDSGRFCYCGPSEFAIGQAAAQACALAVRSRSNTVMLLHAGADDAVYGSRYAGFKHELPVVGDVHLLREIDCGGQWLDAAHIVRKESRMYPRVGCWVMLDDWPLRVVRPSDPLLPLGCGIVLCCDSPRYIDRMRNGQIMAMVAFDYRRAVQNAILIAADLGNAPMEENESSWILPSEIITAAELDAYEQRWIEWGRCEPGDGARSPD